MTFTISRTSHFGDDGGQPLRHPSLTSRKVTDGYGEEHRVYSIELTTLAELRGLMAQEGRLIMGAGPSTLWDGTEIDSQPSIEIYDDWRE